MNRTQAWRRVTAEEARTLLDTLNLRIYDARDPTAYSAGHIGAAQPLSEANLERVLFGTPKGQPVLIYCYHGNASQTYAQMFQDFGFKEVYDLIDGYEAWQRVSRPSGLDETFPAELSAWLTEHGFPADNLDAVRENRMTPLMHAARLGDFGAVDALLSVGADVSALNSDGNNALWLACYGENIAVIERLADAGIAIDHANDNGSTCLMYAASAGKTAVVERLLTVGADVTRRNLDDFSALDMAANIECLTLLRKAEKRGRSKAA